MPIRRVERNSAADRSDWGRLRLILFDDLSPEFNQADMAAFEARHEQEVFLAFVGDDADSAVAQPGGDAAPGSAVRSPSAVGFAEVALRNLVDGCLTSPVGYLEAIYVSPEARGHGLGRKLLDASIAWARDQGCTEFATDSDLADTAAQAFHLANGMKETYRIVQFRREI